MSIFIKIFGGGGKPKTELFVPPPPPSKEAIAVAETSLKIRFPQSFITFMQSSRQMNLPACARFYWVGEENLGERNILFANRQEHMASASPLPEFLVAFYNDGMGNQVCFDTRSHSEDGEYSIVFWDHELEASENLKASEHLSANPESAGVIAPSFFDWLKLIENN
jgi:hypothetical protein